MAVVTLFTINFVVDSRIKCEIAMDYRSFIAVLFFYIYFCKKVIIYVSMKKIYLGLMLLALMLIIGCDENTEQDVFTIQEMSASKFSVKKRSLSEAEKIAIDFLKERNDGSQSRSLDLSIEQSYLYECGINTVVGKYNYSPVKIVTEIKPK